MKTIRIFLALALLAGLFSCKPAELVLDPSLTAKAMPVKGRQGLMIGQVVSYGAYKTGKVRRGWTGSYDLPFIVRFRGAREKLSYVQYSPGGMQAEVACVSRFKSTELTLLKDFFNIPLNLKNYFAGTITFGEGGATWDFILHNPDGDFLRKKESAGYIQNGSERIEINALRELKGQPKWMNELTVYGHEFYYEGKVAGAVSTINKGTVWIDPALSPEVKTVLAAVATGLLLRTDVEEAADAAP
jgi:hypothetical protein